MPLPDSALYSFFDQLATRWDAMQSPEREAHLRHILEPYAALFAGVTRALDIGSGTGAFFPHLVRLAPDAHITAIDLSQVMLAHAKDRADGRCAYLRADALALPVLTASADLVTCHDSFAHFEDRPAALREFWRALVPGGHLLILHDAGRERINEIHRGSLEPRIRRHTLPPVNELAAIVRRAGFAVLAAVDAPDHYLVSARREQPLSQ